MSPYDTLASAPGAAAHSAAGPLIDPFDRSIDYLRVSVTDRCNLRCVYCMSERQTFLPKAQVLSLEELDRLCTAFIGLGTRKLRLTGGEPLVRKGFMDLVRSLSRHLKSGALDQLTLTTNGTHLAEHGEKSGSGVGASPMAFGHEMHRALIGNFIDAIQDGAPLRVTGEDALKAHRFIEAILKASA